MKKTLQISLEDAKEMIKVLPSMKDTLEELYPELKPSTVPNSWYDIKGRLCGFYMCGNGSIDSINDISYIKGNNNVFATAKQAKSAVAYAQLTQLMKAVGDCNVDWTSENIKYCIVCCDGYLKVEGRRGMKEKLPFNTPEVAKEFLNKHRQLISQYYEI